MAHENLKRQLKDLFSGLTDTLSNLEASVAVGPETKRSIDQLESLFSDLEDPAETDQPSDPTVKVTDDQPPEIAPAKAKLQVTEQDKITPETKRGEEPGGDQVRRSPIARRSVKPSTSRRVSQRRRTEPKPIQKQNKWTSTPLFEAAADSDPNVARLALEALAEMGVVLNRELLALAQQPGVPPHRGGEAYLSYLLDQPLVYVPLGSHLMGSDPTVDEMAETNEQPQHELSLPGYWIARYPVTIAQFNDFVEESGYQPSGINCFNGQEDEPVVDVSWHDALAYCRWLSERGGVPVTLPSEAEWEKAARGLDDRRYPWGNQPPTTELCNFHRAPVGRYSPQADSPYGCVDMAGNVWEWTRSVYRPYPYDPADGREDMENSGARVVRGLTFNNLERFTRCAFRYYLKQNLRLLTLGFRVVVSPTTALHF